MDVLKSMAAAENVNMKTHCYKEYHTVQRKWYNPVASV